MSQAAWSLAKRPVVLVFLALFVGSAMGMRLAGGFARVGLAEVASHVGSRRRQPGRGGATRRRAPVAAPAPRDDPPVATQPRRQGARRAPAARDQRRATRSAKTRAATAPKGSVGANAGGGRGGQQRTLHRRAGGQRRGEGAVARAAALRRRRPSPKLGPAILGTLPEDVLRDVLGYIPRSPQVAMSFGKGPAMLWQGGAPERRLQAHHSRINDMKFFPDGNRLLTAGADGRAIIWCALTGRVLLELIGGHKRTTNLFMTQVFPDSKRVVTLGSDQLAIIWSADTGRVLTRLDMRGVRTQHVVRVFPKGDRLITGVAFVWEEPAIIWNTTDGTELFRLVHPHDSVMAFDLSPCGQKLVTAGVASIMLWDATTGQMEKQLRGRVNHITGVSISVGGAKVVVNGPQVGHLDIYDGVTGHLNRTMTFKDGPVAPVLLGDGDRLLTFTEAQAIVWDLHTGKAIRGLRNAGLGGEKILRVVASPDGEVVARCTGAGERGSERQRMRVWDVSTGQLRHSILGEESKDVSSPTWMAGQSPCSIAVGAAGSFWGLPDA